MTKKAIITTHDDREATIVTKASNVLFEDGQTAQDILNDRQDTMITPVITTSTSMSKVGQGDSVDYSENVVDGAYESCVLKGNTKVNLIQEPSSQDVVLPYEFTDGQSVTITDTKESGALGVELKGQTLVNLLESSNIRITNGSVNEINFTYGLDTSKTYILKYRINTMPTLTDTSDAARLVKLEWYNNSSGGFKNILVGDITVGENKYVKIPPFNGEVTQNSFRLWSPLFSSGELDIDLALLEYQQGMENWDIPYFEGMKSVKAPSVTTVGKNLFDYSSHPITLDRLAYTDGQQVYWIGYIGVKTYVPVKENTTYTYSNDINVGIHYGLVFYDDDKRVLSYINDFKTNNSFTSFTTPSKCKFIRFAMQTQQIPQWIQLEEGSSPTTYEPHKSSILSLPEEVVLRSLPNGVCDTFNTRTGVYTRYIEEVVLNGADPITSLMTIINDVNTTTARCFLEYGKIPDNIAMKRYSSANTASDKIICDLLPTLGVVPDMQTTDIESIGQTTVGFSIRVRGKSITECKQRLAERPVTILYERQVPIVTKINLSSTLKSWNTTTHIYSEIQEGTLYPILSHSNPTYPVILKPSTKYSIVANSYSNDHTNSTINFNLGGATASTTVGNRVCTVTTPSTLTSEKLVMSGRGNKLNNVMVIEGDVVGDEPYFEGMCDSKSPILLNVGKNLFDNVFTVGGWWNGVSNRNPDFMRSVNLTPVKPNTTYAYDSTVKGHRQNANFMAHDADGNFIKYLGFGRTFTTPSNCHYIHLYTENDDSLYAQIEEGAVSTTIEPYKSNILSANGDKIDFVKDDFEQGTVSGATNTGLTYEAIKGHVTHILRTKNVFRVKPNTTYIAKNSGGYKNSVIGFDNNMLTCGYETSNWGATEVFTTPSNCYYLALLIGKEYGDSFTVSNLDNVEIQLVEVDKTIVLRSLPNGVCDTLNVETGEYVQRIKEIVLDGSSNESWVKNTSLSDNNYTVLHNIGYTGMKVETHSLVGNMNCDKFKNEWYAIDGGEGVARYVDGTEIVLKISTSKLTTQDTTGLRTYLQSNPITVQYELQTPIVKTVDLSGYPFSYENGHVVLSSGSIEQSLTPTVEYSVATNRNGQIRSNQKMVEKHQKELDKLQAIILANLINSQYQQTLTTLKYELSRV